MHMRNVKNLKPIELANAYMILSFIYIKKSISKLDKTHRNYIHSLELRSWKNHGHFHSQYVLNVQDYWVLVCT
jgi:hypothetical protein